MDFAAVVNRGKRLAVEDLARDADFAPAVHVRTTLAAYKASRAFDRPYLHPDRRDFVRAHQEQWATFVHNLAHWEEMADRIELPRRERVLVAAWHFAEIVAAFRYAKEIHALLLVSQDPPWLEALRQDGCTLNFRETGAARKLVQEMRSGRIVAAMLDHSFPGTQCEPARLFGRVVSTPSGVLELCSRDGYLIAFVAPRPGGIEVVGQIDAAGRPAAELAQQYNDWLEHEVRRSPAKWLMWQAFPLV